MAPGKIAGGFFPSFTNTALYDDAIGIAGMYGSGSGSVCYTIMQLDGTTDNRAFFTDVNHFVLDLQSDGWLVAQGTSNIYGWDEQSGVEIPTAPLLTGVVAALDAQVRCRDRYLWFTVDGISHTLTVYSNDLTLAGSWTAEATLTGFSANSGTTVSRGSPGGQDIYIACTGGLGEVCHYDTMLKTFSGTIGYLGSNIAAWYSPALGVFVMVGGTIPAPTVSIYATAPNPSALSAPSVSGGITAGQVATVAATLTGSDGEPCPNELVTWILTAGDGELTGSQSATDATGKATIGYVAPFTVVTNPTITASVNF
jgi:hypothetical protein